MSVRTPHASARRTRPIRTAAGAGVALAAAALVVAVAAWLLPDPLGLGPSRTPTAAVSTTGAAEPVGQAGVTAGGSGPSGPARADDAVYLDTLEPATGRDRLTGLPRALAGTAGYERAVVIECPSNASDDKATEVTYQLSRRYLDVSATVRAYSPDRVDADAPVWVTPVLVTIQRDGLPATVDGPRTIVTQRRSGRLAAPVDGLDQLRLRIQCESPRSMAILVGAAVTKS